MSSSYDGIFRSVTDLRYQEQAPKTGPLTPEEISELVALCQVQKAEIKRLRSEQSLLGVLRELACDPACPPHIRLKAAEAGVQYELPKPASTSNFNIGFSPERNMKTITEALEARKQAANITDVIVTEAVISDE